MRQALVSFYKLQLIGNWTVQSASLLDNLSETPRNESKDWECKCCWTKYIATLECGPAEAHLVLTKIVTGLQYCFPKLSKPNST